MRTVTLLQPPRIVVGSGCFEQAVEYVSCLANQGISRIHVIASPSQVEHAAAFVTRLPKSAVTIDSSISKEPTIQLFLGALAKAKEANAQCIVGLGGGSPLDVAKLVAALVQSDQELQNVFGIGLLRGRSCHLVCIPTTSGTGSEVSPNAIMLDEAACLKKGVISPFLLPDAAFIDPALTLSLSPSITASTGVDALTHCIEAYTNRFSHAAVDVYAREGISLCSRYLARAVSHPYDLEAREAMSLVSLCGGLCLGPVNTAAVHALAYPLGSQFHVPHGLSNAVLLSHVFRFNAEVAPARHAEVARMLGVSSNGGDAEVAQAGMLRIVELLSECGISIDMASYGIQRSDIPRMARSTMSVTRLLRNNPREVTEADCIALYERCFDASVQVI